MANKKCIYIDLNTVQILSQSSPAFITVDKPGDVGQEVWVYQKEYNSTEGYVLNYLGEDSFMEYASRLTELIDYMARIDLGITKTAIDNSILNFSLSNTYNSANGLPRFNCKNSNPVTGSASTFTFIDQNSVPISSFISQSERIMINGARTTAYTPYSTSGKIVFDSNVSTGSNLLADFNILSTQSYITLTSTGWTT